MPDIVVGLLVVALCGERAWSEWLHARERRYLINAAIADTPAELRQLEQKPPRERERKPLPEGFEGQVGI